MQQLCAHRKSAFPKSRKRNHHTADFSDHSKGRKIMSLNMWKVSDAITRMLRAHLKRPVSSLTGIFQNFRPFLTVDKNLRQKHDFGPKPTSKIRPILTVRQKFGQKKWIRTYVRSTWTMKGTLKPNRWSDWSVHDREAQNEMTTIKSNIPWSKLFILYWAYVLFFKETVMLDQLQGRTFIVFLKTPASRCGQVNWL
jgi:hypothetical protein